MRASKLLATLALSAVLFTGCGTSQNAIIKINDQAITQAEYDKLMDRSIGQSPFGKLGDLKGNKDGFLYLMMEQNVINQLIITELLEQEAKDRGIKVTSKDVDEALLAYQNGDLGLHAKIFIRMYKEIYNSICKKENK